MEEFGNTTVSSLLAKPNSKLGLESTIFVVCSLLEDFAELLLEATELEEATTLEDEVDFAELLDVAELDEATFDEEVTVDDEDCVIDEDELLEATTFTLPVTVIVFS